MLPGFEKQLSGLVDTGASKVLAAVSGGVDSMTMASLLAEILPPERLAVAHCNFNLRGEESDGDEALVADWCRKNNLKFFLKRFSTLDYAKENRISTEMSARDLRYGWFRELMDREGFDRLAIAHNLNDRAETLFLNLLRGTGTRGLGGIRKANDRIVRPLLDYSREAIESYAREHGIPFREDSTNRESVFSRNRIRNEVFPQFARINPSFLSTLKAEMDRFEEVESLLEGLCKAREGELYGWNAKGVFGIDLSQLKMGSHTKFWLFRLLDAYGFNGPQLDSIAASLEGQSGKRFYSGTHVAVKDRDYLMVYPIYDGSVPEIKVEIADKPAGFDPKGLPKGTLCVDAGKISLPLRFRAPREGDRFIPLGMKGSKLLSDFFTDLKLDVEQKARETVAVTTAENGEENIVAVIGRRIDERYKVEESTEKICYLSDIY